MWDAQNHHSHPLQRQKCPIGLLWRPQLSAPVTQAPKNVTPPLAAPAAKSACSSKVSVSGDASGVGWEWGLQKISYGWVGWGLLVCGVSAGPLPAGPPSQVPASTNFLPQILLPAVDASCRRSPASNTAAAQWLFMRMLTANRL